MLGSILAQYFEVLWTETKCWLIKKSKKYRGQLTITLIDQALKVLNVKKNFFH